MGRTEYHVICLLILLSGIVSTGCLNRAVGKWVFNAQSGDVLGGQVNQCKFDGALDEAIGLRSGLLTVWDENGDKREVPYLCGKKEGVEKRWSPDGVVVCQGRWENNERVGIWRLWWPNGAKHSVLQYDRGRLHGICANWDQNGEKIAEEEYTCGSLSGLLSNWYTNGMPKIKCSIREGDIDGRFRAWLPDGRLVVDGEYREGKRWEGTFLKYSPGPDSHEWIGVMTWHEGQFVTNRPLGAVVEEFGAGLPETSNRRSRGMGIGSPQSTNEMTR